MEYYESLRRISEKYSELIQKLIITDDLEEWAKLTQNFSKDDRKKIYDIAEPEWIERKLLNGTLLVHPDVHVQLENRKFKPLSIHRKMIWASVLVMLEGPDTKERYHRIREKIIKKHGKKWWFDVSKRIKPTYAAKSRLENQILGPAASVAAKNSLVFGLMVQSSRDDILKMIPKE